MPLTKQSIIACLKNSCSISVENHCIKQLMTLFLIDKNRTQPIPIHIMEQVSVGSEVNLVTRLTERRRKNERARLAQTQVWG